MYKNTTKNRGCKQLEDEGLLIRRVISRPLLQLTFLWTEIYDTIIDIGKQDKVKWSPLYLGCGWRFLMNEAKCAAGTGQRRWNESKVWMERIDTVKRDAKPAKINSMCALLAESKLLTTAQILQIAWVILPDVESISSANRCITSKWRFQRIQKVFFSGDY